MRLPTAALAALTLIAMSGCAATRSSDAGTVTVLAAASLTESFTEIGAAFESAHPGVRVSFSFGGSSTLATQIVQGAPADVFAAASAATMRTVTAAGAADGDAVTFASNQLVIAVATGNPAGITGLADLTAPGLKVALCAEQVPCGAAAKQALAAASVRLTPVTLEQDVRAALAKVKLGEVDAALVYRTDAQAAASDLDAVEFAESGQAVNDYPIVVVKDAPNRAMAQAFVDHVRSAAGRAVLTRAGFQVP